MGYSTDAPRQAPHSGLLTITDISTYSHGYPPGCLSLLLIFLHGITSKVIKQRKSKTVSANNRQKFLVGAWRHNGHLSQQELGFLTKRAWVLNLTEINNLLVFRVFQTLRLWLLQYCVHLYGKRGPALLTLVDMAKLLHQGELLCQSQNSAGQCQFLYNLINGIIIKLLDSHQMGKKGIPVCI